MRIARDECQRPYRYLLLVSPDLYSVVVEPGHIKMAGALPFTKVKAVAHLKIRNPALIPHRQTCPGLPDKILFGGGSYSPG